MKNHKILCQKEAEKNLEPKKTFGDRTEKNLYVISTKIKNDSMKNVCRDTGKKKQGPPFKTNDLFIEDARRVHGNKYDYSKSKYVNNRTKVEIVCDTHGSFFQLPFNHIGKYRYGCPKCGGELLGKLLSSNTEKFVEKSIKVHGKIYNYSKVKYTRNCDKVIITCKLHGDFLQIPQTHLHGSGCPKCTRRISKPEIEFLNYCKVDENNRQKYVGRYLVDGLQDGIVYEFLGNYWHGNPRLFDQTKIHPKVKKTYGDIYKSTIKKLDELVALGYTVKYIWEDEWNDWKKQNSLGESKITTI